MDRINQIEEMAKAILYVGDTYDTLLKEDCETIASIIYEAGYRKPSEVVKEIFEKLYASIKFDGHSVSVWKNDLLQIAKEYGVSLE